ncbi:thiopeptide-type bacteriocin biosynthesis protein [Solwaraspora sp. WMMD1047]|uniref:thiopeptide-type bacteriocin biosynthesis protein n=1 Tax=Solwaraspora sp. WMMD1047 TaxID=3016102 RepID=UPI00241679D0|nr:thiopeptide-type bacteriocin biosynthesis protein [Solwaraspora sp. WMMD1047]MDG4832114.1 thiopeptide-type bacteriocin biosynthesis protein [Solwaraspora sp. WMMD1047]
MTGWISLHIYYASNSDPMLLRCVGPLVADLRDRGLLRRWFFIRYWLEGPHVRLRLLPADESAAEEVRLAAQEAIGAFLKNRPALYDASTAGAGDVYRQLYIAEYGEQRWDETYGASGGMPFQPNNSVRGEAYEPEYDRYGGPAGVELAERHFEVSSNLVLRLLETTNAHVSSVRLGSSAQLAAALCYAFLGTDERVARFFTDYRRFWENLHQESSDVYHSRFDEGFERVATGLRGHLARLRDAVRDPDRARLTALERGWVRHALALREEVVGLAASGALVFHRRSEDAPTTVTDPDIAFTVLLSSYVHMTNNRIGTSILDEIYLSYLMVRALTDAEPVPA